MSFPGSSLSTATLNRSSHYSSRRNPSDKCLLRFSDDFLDPSDEISKWYNMQPYKRFRTIQYRKEKTGVRHEFIVIRLKGEGGGVIKSHCRLERMGDSEHLLQTMYIDGTIAEDYIHAIPFTAVEPAETSPNSDLVLEITFPIFFDLRDVLAICYGISKHRKAKRYTLQQYNCYFFSWTVTLILARACIRWDINSTSLENIQARNIQSMNEQGSSRFHSLAYILANNASTNHLDGGEHPLDRVIRSRVTSKEFAGSIPEALHGLLWISTLQARLITTLTAQSEEIARESFKLLIQKERDPGTVQTSDLGKREIDLDVVSAVRKAIEKAITMRNETLPVSLCRLYKEASQDAAIVRQRIGSVVWYRCVRRGICHLLNSGKFPSYDECERAGSHYLLKGSPAMDRLLIPPTFVLSLCFRLGFTGFISISSSVLHSNMKYQIRRYGNHSTLYLIARFVGSTVGRTIIDMPKGWAFSKQLRYALALYYATTQDLSVEILEFCDPFREFQPNQLLLESWTPALEQLNDTLNSIKANNEPHSSIIRRDLLDIFRAIDTAMPVKFRELWEVILWQYSDQMVQVAHSQLQGPVELASTRAMFEVVGEKGTSEPAQIQVLTLIIIKELPKGIESTPFSFSRLKPPNSAKQGSNTWSYEKLQQLIRHRISQLSKRETEFAPALKHIPHPQSPERYQMQIEATMEEIWGLCKLVMVTPPQE